MPGFQNRLGTNLLSVGVEHAAHMTRLFHQDCFSSRWLSSVSRVCRVWAYLPTSAYYLCERGVSCLQ